MPPEQMRASDADRERVVAVLREAYAGGQLDAEEYEERLESAYTARTLGELAPITGDLLPGEQQPVQLRSTPVTAFFGHVSRTGRWVVPGRHVTLAAFGTAELDLREALFAERHIRLDVSSLFGRVTILVPDGVEVRMRGRSIAGRRRSTARRQQPGAAVLEIEGVSVLGSVEVIAPKRRRRWLPWRRSR